MQNAMLVGVKKSFGPFGPIQSQCSRETTTAVHVMAGAIAYVRKLEMHTYMSDYYVM